MSLIERAAKRLEELKRAGIELPSDEPAKDRRDDGKAESRSTKWQSADARSVAGQFDSPSSSSTFFASTNSSATEPPHRFELDLERLALLGFITPDVKRSRIADEFRILKRPLLTNASAKGNSQGERRNLIMVTSALPGEGKTFTALNLAMSLALELDKTVLLVDSDVARPSLPKLLGIQTCKGLLDVLAGDTKDLAQVLLHTNIEKLSILPSGTPTQNATELLASSAMTSLLADISGRYVDRIVIFDSPPLLVTTEARVLAAQMGQIVFVVHAETTLQSDVKRALATIDACPLKMMVLNQATSNSQGAHGYGYGYGYGS